MPYNTNKIGNARKREDLDKWYTKTTEYYFI
jgi:hypothetical protein